MPSKGKKVTKQSVHFVETCVHTDRVSTTSFSIDAQSREVKCTVTSSSTPVLSTVTDLLKSTFLPIGYPHSVRPEYLQYQIWDSIQGISSYLRSVLTTRSVLTGIGVGSTSTTPLSAALVWVMRDGMGMIGSLLCAYCYSESFEVYTKEWRLFADVLNNIGLTLDLLSSLIPSQYFFFVTSVSVLSKSCCGLIAGATKAKISAHFALSGHLSDVTVKESTQETAVALCGLVLGTILTKVIGTDERSTWLVFFVLLCIHQLSNYLLVKVLVLDTFNPQRCFLLTSLSFSHNSSAMMRAASVFPSPAKVAAYENFYWPFYLSFYGPVLGASIGEALQAVAECNTDGDIKGGTLCDALLSLWEKEPFLVSLSSRGRVIVCLEEGCSEKNVVKAYLLACHVHIQLQELKKNNGSHSDVSGASLLDWLTRTACPRAIDWFDNVVQFAQVDSHGTPQIGMWNLSDHSAIKPGPFRYSRGSEYKKLK